MEQRFAILGPHDPQPPIDRAGQRHLYSPTSKRLPCSAASPGTRVKVEDSPYYLDEAAVKMKNDVATFKLYTSFEASDPGTDSTLTCATREFSARTGEQWSAPYRVLAGVSLYPVGKKLCDWDAKGFFQRFFSWWKSGRPLAARGKESKIQEVTASWRGGNPGS